MKINNNTGFYYSVFKTLKNEKNIKDCIFLPNLSINNLFTSYCQVYIKNQLEEDKISEQMELELVDPFTGKKLK